MTNRIDIKELWHDVTGQFCSEISVDGRRVAACYSPEIELMLVNTLADQYCEVWRSVRRREPQLVRKATAA